MSTHPVSVPVIETDRAPLKRGLKHQLVDALGSEIVAGRLLPGELLPAEAVLLARYAVSRTVLREALSVLSAKGLIKTRQKRGTMVNPRLEWNQLDPSIIDWSGASDDIRFSPALAERLDQLIEVRHIIEPAAARLAAQRATPDDRARMTTAYRAMEAAGDDIAAFMQADLAFHIACLRASHNDFLLPIAHAIRTAMTTSLRITTSDPDANHAISLPLHKAILDAVLAGNGPDAVTAMTRHLEDTKRRRDAQGRRQRPVVKPGRSASRPAGAARPARRTLPSP